MRPPVRWISSADHSICADRDDVAGERTQPGRQERQRDRQARRSRRRGTIATHTWVWIDLLLALPGVGREDERDGDPAKSTARP